MKSLCFSFIVLASFATLLSVVADAHRFNVGGNGAWVINPQESYQSWAERNRFQVNDTIYFKYAKGSDSVQLVTKPDFDGCNIKNPVEKFVNGESEVALNRSGPFYFISGNQDRCMKGQKLVVVVLAIRNHPIVQPPKAHSPVSPIAPAKAPSTAQPPKAHSPVTHSPAVSPSQAPKTSPPKHSPPSKSPTSSPKNSPRSSPSAKSPSPSASSPAKSPTASPSPDHLPASPAPEKIPTSSPTPSESTPTADNNKAPAPSPKSAASGVAVTSVMTTLFSAALTVLMFA